MQFYTSPCPSLLPSLYWLEEVMESEVEEVPYQSVVRTVPYQNQQCCAHFRTRCCTHCTWYKHDGQCCWTFSIFTQVMELYGHMQQPSKPKPTKPFFQSSRSLPILANFVMCTWSLVLQLYENFAQSTSCMWKPLSGVCHLVKLMWALNRGNRQWNLPKCTLQCRQFVQILSKSKLCCNAFTAQWAACASLWPYRYALYKPSRTTSQELQLIKIMLSNCNGSRKRLGHNWFKRC